MSGIVSPGVYYDMPSDEYFADPCPEPSLTQSLAKVLIAHSPLHARQEHPRLKVEVDDEADDEAEKYIKAKAIGNAAHKIMLGRGKEVAIVDAPDFKSKAAKDAGDDAAAAGHVIILRKHHLIAQRMVLSGAMQLDAIEGAERAFKRDAGDGEVVIACKYRGVWLRQMLDWPTKDLREVWDYKTTGLSASPYETGKLMSSAGWNVQAAMTDIILGELDPEGAGRRRYFFVPHEQYSPFALSVCEVGEAALTIGRKKIEYAIDRWIECMSSRKWPAYPLRIIRPELPEWDVNRWLAREVQEWDEREAAQPKSKILTNLAGG
ncbi:hypothetical protein [Afipia carboxidovorans]|uniref:hypothetical protein n=1 Tax=Afipia carboxidovorans TaxID=40137 RepID=UPI0030867FC4|nr:hypothetical protein CRBSH125_05690 [Afipia carboxidovorans]